MRDQLRDALQSRKIATAVYYPAPLHVQRCFRELGYSAGEFPESERAARQTLALPMFPELTIQQQEHVVSALGEAAGD